MDSDSSIGKVEWFDLTVDDASTVSDFYRQVVGWTIENTSMGEYNDFTLCTPGDGEGLTGVCHARGSNKNMPAQWLLYVRVQNVQSSATTCVELGGEIITGPKPMGSNPDGDHICVIRDPAGAVMALVSSPPT